MRIGLFIRPGIKSLVEILSAIIDFLLSKGQEVIVVDGVDRAITDKYPQITSCNADEISLKVDSLFSIGGDGTFLQAARAVAKSGKPVLGIHIGGMGFLADVSMENYKYRLTAFLNEDFNVEKRSVLSAKIFFRNGTQDEQFAFNDFVIDKGRSIKMIKIDTYVDNEYLHTYRSDGLIISTPTGSTAYSLSAGGPIISPLLDVIIINPICPHSLSVRAVVISDKRVVKVDCSNFDSNVSLAVDGQIFISLGDVEYVEIKRADFYLPLIRFKEDSFFQTLRVKLNWGRDVRGN